MGEKVNQTRLAAILGVTDVTLWEWQKQGMPVEKKGSRGEANEYDTSSVVAWYVEREVAKVRSESPRDALARAQEQLVRLNIAKEQGALVPVADVEAEFERMVLLARQRVLQAPGRVPMDAQTRALMEQELDDALKELSRHEPNACVDAQPVAALHERFDHDHSAGPDSTDRDTLGAASTSLDRGVGGGEALSR